ncbi:MAG TPA: DUF5716 family protein [Mobilitalea sp.]|nr:DUF5716 family protein [Mobilitalea sp.]
MDAPRKLIVGYDLCEDFSQISCYSYKSDEPLTICMGEGEDNDCPIPTALCVKADTRQWLFGVEAISCAQRGEGILIDHLLAKACSDEVTEIYQTKFTGVALLEKYLRKSLTLIKNYFPTEPITKLVLTVHNTDPVLVEKIYEALALLGLDKDRAVVMSHAGAYLYYTLSQDRMLWMNDVGLFDFHKEGLYYYQIRINRRTKPMMACLARADYLPELNYDMVKQINGNAAYIFENIANTVLHKQIVSTLYFTGRGFEGGWAEEVIRKLCAGRRVFLGQNLFSKGACYAAKELSGDRKPEDILLFNDDMVTTSVTVRVYCDTRFKDIPLVEAGDIWYEVNKRIEVIVEGEPELDLALSNIMTRETLRERIMLSKLPERTDRTTRLEINFSCKTKNNGIIKVTDLGFGEFFPGTGTETVYTLDI